MITTVVQRVVDCNDGDQNGKDSWTELVTNVKSNKKKPTRRATQNDDGMEDN